MGYDEGTPGWVVEGSKNHHAFTGCTKLKEEKEIGGQAATNSPFDSQQHSACPECSEKGTRIISKKDRPNE